MKYSWQGHKDRKRYKNRIRRSGQARLVYVKNINLNTPTMKKKERNRRKTERNINSNGVIDLAPSSDWQMSLASQRQGTNTPPYTGLRVVQVGCHCNNKQSTWLLVMQPVERPSLGLTDTNRCIPHSSATPSKSPRRPSFNYSISQSGQSNLLPVIARRYF